MRKTVTIIGAGVLGVYAFQAFTNAHWFAGACSLAGALAILLPAMLGRGFGQWSDAERLMGMIRNPTGTLLDVGLDRVGNLADRKAATDQPVQPAFDPDAALARYMECREGPADPSPPAPPVSAFGRKQA